jgi:hypothetical protein
MKKSSYGCHHIFNKSFVQYFLFIASIALFVGFVIYLFMRKPKLRRIRPITFLDDFDEAPISKRCSIVAGLAVALPLIIYAYFDSWQHFYSVSQESDQLYLRYYFPNRKIRLTDASRLQITSQYEVRRGASYRIKIADTERNEYTSQVMVGRELDVNLASLKNALKPYRNIKKTNHTLH